MCVEDPFSQIRSHFGKYSENLAKVASELPHSMHLYNQSVENIMPVNNFVKKAVCVSCETLYNFKDCYKTVGLNNTIILHCTNKPFQKQCGELLMKEIIDRRRKGATVGGAQKLWW